MADARVSTSLTVPSGVIEARFCKLQMILRMCGWLAAMVAADLLDIILITAVVSLHDDPSEWRRLPAALRALVLDATSIALISTIAVQSNPAAATILAVLYAVMHVGYRGYVRHSQGNAQVENLYAFASALDSSLDTGQLMRVILGQVRDELRSSNVELILPPSATASGLQVQLSGQGQIDETLTHGSAPDAWWAPAASAEPVLLPADPVDAMAVPVPGGDGVTDVLLVTDCLPDIPTFTADICGCCRRWRTMPASRWPTPGWWIGYARRPPRKRLSSAPPCSSATPSAHASSEKE